MRSTQPRHPTAPHSDNPGCTSRCFSQHTLPRGCEDGYRRSTARSLASMYSIWIPFSFKRTWRSSENTTRSLRPSFACSSHCCKRLVSGWIRNGCLKAALSRSYCGRSNGPRMFPPYAVRSRSCSLSPMASERGRVWARRPVELSTIDTEPVNVGRIECHSHDGGVRRVQARPHESARRARSATRKGVRGPGHLVQACSDPWLASS